MSAFSSGDSILRDVPTALIIKSDSQLDKVKTYVSPELKEQLSKHRGKLIKISENEYMPLANLNSQDQEDVRNIKSLEKVANERIK